jgi:selenocysteine-specific elongation factor
MREVILGTAGHVDHGKTSLIRALTGIDTDRLKEEKERGITIELGFAFLDLPSGHRLGIVDVPGHERFVKNMVAGAAGIDLVAFVIAADEGVMPQTREHFEICRLLGVNKGLIVITKKDLVDPDWLDMVIDDVRDFFTHTFLEDAPLITVSSTTGDSIDRVKTVIDELVTSIALPDAHGPFRLPIDRIFSMKGFGAVVTGTSISGRIRVGDEIVIYPKETNGKIRGIQVHANSVQEVEAGRRTAINIQGLDKELISRGDVVATPGCLQPSFVLDADFLYIAANKKKLKHRTRVRIHLGTAEITGRISLLEEDELSPDSTANVQLLLEEPASVWPGDRFVVRSYSPITTIGGGGILNSAAQKRRRLKPADRAENNRIFQIYHNNIPEELALLHLQEGGFHGLTFDQLSVKTALFGNRLKKVLQGPISARKILVIDSDKQRMLAADMYQQLPLQAVDLLAAFHKNNPLQPGIVKEELRTRLGRGLDQRLFHFLLNDLIKQKIVVQDQAHLRLASHKVALKDEENKLRQDLTSDYQAAGIAPPTIKEILEKYSHHPETIIREILGVMIQDKVLVKINESLYFPAGPLAELEKEVVAFIQKEGEIDASRFKNLTGLTRKYTIPLLEYFDKIKVTIRVGDKRILREKHGGA